MPTYTMEQLRALANLLRLGGNRNQAAHLLGITSKGPTRTRALNQAAKQLQPDRLKPLTFTELRDELRTTHTIAQATKAATRTPH